MSYQIAKRWFSVDEYYRMAEAGILTEDDRVELIEGEIIEMSPIGSRHAGCVNRLTAMLTRQLGEAAVVAVQNPVRIDEYSEPEPDLAALKPRADFYSEEHPGPADVMIVVEVADSSVEFDRNKKLPLYAGANVPEVWLVNLPQETIEVYTQPVGGTYREIRPVKRGEDLVSKTISNLTLETDAVLG